MAESKESSESSLFLDTSIQIARCVHSRQMKQRIKERIDQHDQTATSLVVRQEFKRRLLSEAEYLLRLLHHYKSFDEIYHHVVGRLPSKWRRMERKRNICLQTLGQVVGGTDKEKTDRLRLYLRSLLVDGLRRFDQSVDIIKEHSACACARQGIVEREAFRRYDLGEKHCSRNKSACGILQFLTSCQVNWRAIHDRLNSIPDSKKSAEIKDAKSFLDRFLSKPDKVRDDDPCLTVGDLLIALESAGIAFLYTLNSKESQHFCRALDQTLIVRPIDPTKPEVVCHKDDSEWPSFGTEK